MADLLEKGKRYLVKDFDTYSHDIKEIECLEVSDKHYKIMFKGKSDYFKWIEKSEFSIKEEGARTWDYLILEKL